MPETEGSDGSLAGWAEALFGSDLAGAALLLAVLVIWIGAWLFFREYFRSRRKASGDRTGADHPKRDTPLASRSEQSYLSAKDTGESRDD